MAGDHHHPLYHPAAVSYGTPETEPRAFGFWDFGPTPPPASRWRTCSPPAASVSSTRTHHILASSYAAVSHDTPGTEPRVLSFWDFGPSPAPGFALANVQLETEPRALGFWVFGPTPTPGFAVANVQPPRRLRVINLHPPPSSITLRRCFTRHTRNRATKARFSGFWPKPHNPASRWRMPSPAASTFSFTRTHHLPGLHHTTVL